MLATISSGLPVAAQHVGVGHARHRHVGVAFAAAVAGRLDLHEARVHRVLDVALQDAVFDQHVALAGVALVVDVERTTAIGDRAVVQHRHALGRHALADAARKRARALAVEVAFQAVANGFVQQDAGPARAEHDRHFAGRCRARLEIRQCGLDGLVDVFRDVLVVEVGEAEAPAAAAGADLAPAVLFGDHRDRQAHQRPHVGRQRAVGARDQHHVVFAREAGHHLGDARIARPGELLDLAEQFDLWLCCRASRSDRRRCRATGFPLSFW